MSAHAAAFLLVSYIGASATTIPDVARFSVLNYAFAEPAADGTCHKLSDGQLHGMARLRTVRAMHPGMRLVVSVGGWSAGASYSDAARTPQSRQAFAQTCVANFVEASDFDGLDIDWEFPVHGGVPQNPHRPEDRKNVTLLFAAIRHELNVLGTARHRHYLLTAATPAAMWETGGKYSVTDSYDLAAVAKSLDWFNVMTYDMNTSASPVTGFSAPMCCGRNSVPAQIALYESHGVPASKIVLGIPLYGRGYTGVPSMHDGFHQPFASDYPETDWHTVRSQYLTDPDWAKHWDSSAEVPWLYNAKQRIFFSYDDPRSVAIKARFIKEQHLGGTMFWLAGQDDPNDSLVQVIENVLHE